VPYIVGMAGKANFTPDEWATMQRAVVGAPLLVAVSDGGLSDLRLELHAIGAKLAEARAGHSSELVQALADIAAAQTGFHGRMNMSEVEGPALQALGSAVETLREKAPDELDSFRYFVLDLAKTTAAAARSGPFALIGPLVSEREAKAVDRIKAAIGIQ
jgi:hypothetical protein